MFIQKGEIVENSHIGEFYLGMPMEQLLTLIGSDYVESEYVENLLKKSGYQIVSFDSDDADVYIINTCSVTNEADRKSRKIINRAKKHFSCLGFTWEFVVLLYRL